jgi:hypothetical protein
MNTMNLKKAYRLFVSATKSAKEGKENLLFSAQCLGIPVSVEKALNPKNQKALERTKYWVALKFRVESFLKEAVIKALQESGQLFVDQEFFSEEDKVIVTAIYSDKFVVKDVSGRKCPNHNVLHYFPFDMSVLPGEDFEGESFWKERVK